MAKPLRPPEPGRPLCSADRYRTLLLRSWPCRFRPIARAQEQYVYDTKVEADTLPENRRVKSRKIPSVPPQQDRPITPVPPEADP